MFKTDTLKLNDIIVSGQKYLLKNNITNAKKEIEWFLIDKFKLNIADIKLNPDKKISQFKKKQFVNFIDKRGEGKPFQYILNKSNFYGYDFFVNSKTLIPRPETELIIDIALKKNQKFDQCLDIGTGSGNLAITLLLQKIATHVDAVDISKNALSVAKKNSLIHKIQKIKFYKKDIFKHQINKKYNLIVSNPPYIKHSDYLKLPSEIRKYEPAVALTDFSNGLTFYKAILKKLKNILNKDGILLIEIGLENTKDSINRIFKNNDFILYWHKDLNGDYRVLEVQYNV